MQKEELNHAGQAVGSRSTRLEREAKLDAPAGLHLAAIELGGGLACGSAAIKRHETVYYDSDDLRLVRNGASLRYRTGEGWTVKIGREERGGGLFRQEHTIAGGREQVPFEATDLVQALLRRAPLKEIASLRTVRRTVPVLASEGQKLAEIVDDSVTVLRDGLPKQHFRELEVELSDIAPDELLPRLVEMLNAHGATLTDQTPKVLRALGLAGNATVVERQTPKRISSVDDLVLSFLRHGLDAIVSNDPGVRLGEDPECVHQARVATRRLRSDLRVFRPLLDRSWVDQLRGELQWLGGALGAVRDDEVLLARLHDRVVQLSAEDAETGDRLLDLLRTRLEERRSELQIVLRSDRYIDLLDGLEDALKGPLPKAEAARPGLSALPGLVRKPWRQLRRSVSSLPANPADSQLHAIRIQAKRCRYVAEAISPLVPRSARFAARCRELQDVLGEHQDSIVAQVWLREAGSRTSAREGVVAGQLLALEADAAAAARARWPKVWRRVLERRPATWLNKMRLKRAASK